MEISGGKGYNDVFVYAPVRAVVEQGDKILARDELPQFLRRPLTRHFPPCSTSTTCTTCPPI